MSTTKKKTTKKKTTTKAKAPRRVKRRPARNGRRRTWAERQRQILPWEPSVMIHPSRGQVALATNTHGQEYVTLMEPEGALEMAGELIKAAAQLDRQAVKNWTAKQLEAL